MGNAEYGALWSCQLKPSVIQNSIRESAVTAKITFLMSIFVLFSSKCHSMLEKNSKKKKINVEWTQMLVQIAAKTSSST